MAIFLLAMGILLMIDARIAGGLLVAGALFFALTSDYRKS